MNSQSNINMPKVSPKQQKHGNEHIRQQKSQISTPSNSQLGSFSKRQRTSNEKNAPLINMYKTYQQIIHKIFRTPHDNKNTHIYVSRSCDGI